MSDREDEGGEQFREEAKGGASGRGHARDDEEEPTRQDDDRRQSKEQRKDRSRERERGNGGGKERERERDRSRSRSRDRDRRRRHRSRSSDRYRSRRSRSRGRDGGRDRRRRSRSSEYRSHRDPPKPYAAPVSGPDPFAAIRQPVPTVDPLEIQRLWQEQQLRARQLVLSQQAVSAKSAASKTQREVYVGNLLPGAISDAMLQQIFNTALAVRFPGSNIPGMEPVIKVNIHKDGRYAFVELRTPEMATAAMDLSGQVQFLGQAMSVNRPSGYVDPTKVTAAAAAATTALHAFQTGAVPGMMGAAAATTIPQLQAIQMVGNLYGNAPVASYPGLPGGMVMPGAGLPLPGPPTAPYPGVPAAAPSAGLPPPPGLGAPLPNNGMSPVPTTCICVVGMVGVDVLLNDLEYDEVLDDLKAECEKQAPGSVAAVKVPRPARPEQSAELINTGNYGKAFVLFRDAGSAQRAHAAINGRMFNGRPITAHFVVPEAFVQA